MKRTHRGDLWTWSTFDPTRNIDFNGFLWVRPGGNVVIDPVPLSTHDEEHLKKLGGAGWVVVTNSDHVRAAREVAKRCEAKIAGPAGEREGFAIECDRWLKEGDELVPGLRALVMDGSKTPGELAFVLEETTLITGDLVRAHEGGKLMLLPAAKLKDRAAALDSVRRLVDPPRIEAVLVGDGWHVFRDGHRLLRELLETAE
jgi:glyoxylase-like metal-dependent hydrolase (beta-lactamase superfamily II)